MVEISFGVLDVNGLPRHSPDFSFDILQEMVTRELTAYTHLRAVWGDLVPRLEYFGHDLAMLWVTVTSYEGVSLSKLAKERGGLTRSVKSKARNALIRLHGLGLIHGDVALRNFLLKDHDDRVLLVDFEQSVLLTDREVLLAEQELMTLEDALESIETLPEEIASSPPPLKRTKVCCCTKHVPSILLS